MSDQTIIECRLHRAARLFGNATALISATEQISFRELDRQVNDRAIELQEQGICHQRWVALRITTSSQGITDWLAAIRAGALVLPVAARMPEAGLQSLLAKQGINSYIPEPGELPRTTAHDDTFTRLGKADNSGSKTVELRLSFAIDQPCAGVLTSGSTGRPRLAVHSYANHVRSAQGSQQLIPLSPEDRYLLSLPLYHVGGLAIIMRCLEAGATIVLDGRAEDVLYLREQRISHISMVETQFRRLLEQYEQHAIELPELRCILLGGGPIADSLLQKALQIGLPCYLSYGMTEMTSQVLTHDPQGRAHILPYREISLAADGEILVRGETLFIGYIYHGTLDPAIDNGGWLRTRDIGRWQGEGLAIIGRKDNQFISGGENIQPEAIEHELRRHPAIRNAVVVSRPDSEFGRRPVAFIDSPGQLPATDELQAWLRERLTAFMIPDEVFALPRQEGLKIQRSHLQQLAEQNLKAP